MARGGETGIVGIYGKPEASRWMGGSQEISREADGKRYRLAQGLPRITIRYYCEMDKYDCAV